MNQHLKVKENFGSDTTMASVCFPMPKVKAQIGSGSVVSFEDRMVYFFTASQDPSKGPSDDNPAVVKQISFRRAFADAQAFQNPDGWSEPTLVRTGDVASLHHRKKLKTAEDVKKAAKAMKAGTETHSIVPAAGSNLLAIRDAEGTITLIWIDKNSVVWGAHSTGSNVWSPRFRFAGTFQALPAAVWLGDQLLLISFDGTNLNCSSYQMGDVRPASDSGLIWNVAQTLPPLINIANNGYTPSDCLSAVLITQPIDANNVMPPAGGTATGVAPILLVSVSSSAPVPSTINAGVWSFTITVDSSSAFPIQTHIYASSWWAANLGVQSLGALDIDSSGAAYFYGEGLAGYNSGNETNYSGLKRTQLSAGPNDAAGLLPTSQTPMQIMAPPGTRSGPFIGNIYVPQVGYVSSFAGPSSLTNGTKTHKTRMVRQYQIVIFSSFTGTQTPQVYVMDHGALHRTEILTDLNVDTGQASLKNPYPMPALVGKGVIDSPLPFPGGNLRLTTQTPPGTIDPANFYAQLGRVVYGQGSSSDTTHEVLVTGETTQELMLSATLGLDEKAEFGVGVEEEVEVEAMFGPRVEAKITESLTSRVATGTKITQEANVIGYTQVVPNSAMPAQPAISPQGFVQGSAISILTNAFYYQAPGSTSNTMPTRHSYATYEPYSNLGLTGHFTSYMVTPGDLNSYSVASINQKMKDKYTTWVNNHPTSQDSFFGTTAQNDYGDGEYFQRVIEKSALIIGNGQKNYLEFSVANDGLTDTRFNMSNHSFKEWGVDITSEFYAGLTAEFTADLAVSIKANTDDGIRLKFSAVTTDTTEAEDSWGISVAMDNFPPAIAPGDTCAYTFRLYFLPADNRWIQEILAFSDYGLNTANIQKTLDPNASPWRIVFTVDPNSVIKLTATPKAPVPPSTPS